MPIYLYVYNIIFFSILLLLICSPVIIAWLLFLNEKTKKYVTNKVTFCSFLLTIIFTIILGIYSCTIGDKYTKSIKLESDMPITQVLYFSQDDKAKVIIANKTSEEIDLNLIENLKLIKDVEKNPTNYVLDKYASKRLGVYHTQFYLRKNN